eukprot:8344233-Karenia_brevis.AAC.1
MQPITVEGFKEKQPEEEVDDIHQTLFMSRLGGAAWLVLTRANRAVYVQALQRGAHKPRAQGC